MITAEDIERFDLCIQKALTSDRSKTGIGTLGERMLHVILKNYFEPDTSFHEIPVGRYIADICRKNEITEIQTRSFSALRPKLLAYSDSYRINVVYPIAKVKQIVWVDPESGEMSKPHKSPKTGQLWNFLFELYALRPIMPLNNVSFTLVLCDMREFRLQNGWGKDKKHGASRYERIPTRLCGIVRLCRTEDYAVLIPESLGSSFTASEFGKAAKMTSRTAGYAIRTLETLGVIRQSGKRGNAYVYERLV